MIKANELRIGNYTDKGRVLTFFEHGVHVGYGNCFNWENIEPIELTPEILDKCGFVFRDGDSENDWRIKNVKHVTLAADQSTDFKIVFVSVGGYEIIQCKHLHQLQNLYFALTGEELEVTL